MSNTPISLAIRMTSTTSTLTGTHHCHSRTPTLIVTRERDGMFLFYGNKFCYWLIKNLATRTTRKRGVNWRSRNHNRNVGWMFRSSLLGNTWLGIGLKV